MRFIYVLSVILWATLCDAVANIGFNDPTCLCPTQFDDDHCRDKSFPVLGGVDFVQYFTDFKLPDGTYNESKIGLVGSAEFQAQFNEFTFYFLSQKNLDMFNACPTCYIPQYGGFCTWGVTGEFCPKYAWSADCLGPAGSWNMWTVYDGKLYFFLHEDPKSKFLQDPATYVVAGDARWYQWFGDQYQSVFDTKCYKTENHYKPTA